MHVVVCYNNFSVTSKLMQSIYDPCMNSCAGTCTLNGIILFNSIIFLHVVIAELLFHLMCIHVHEWISNLLSFFSLVFTGGLLRLTGTVHATLGDFHSTWTTCEPCRFLPSACILTATNLKDIRMSLILENKILKQHANPRCTLYHANNIFFRGD